MLRIPMLGRWSKKAVREHVDHLRALVPEEDFDGALFALHLLVTRGSGIKKSGVCPLKDPRPFELVVAQITAPDIRYPEVQPPHEIFELAHESLNATTLLAGSAITDGIYGDLFYRMLIGYSLVIEAVYEARMGSRPAIDPASRVEPPSLRNFLNRMGHRYAEALGVHFDERADFIASIRAAAASQHVDSQLIAAVRAAGPFKRRYHALDWQLDYTDLIEMTQDELLARVATQAEPM